MFRTAAQRPLLGSGNAGRFVSAWGGIRVKFFTPEASPFSAVDPNPPTFAVGCQWSTRPPSTLHMYVWDQQDRRRIEFTSPRGGVRQQVLQRFIDPIAAVDPQCRVERR
jgi:hypothetical protein